jgi:hypothetical protein
MPGLVRRAALVALAVFAVTSSSFAQVNLSGSWAPRLYEDYIERGPGSDLGDFTGVPMNDEARAKALLYTSNLPSMAERQCLAQAPWVTQFRPRGISIWPDLDGEGEVTAWNLGGDYLRGTLKIWMDGRAAPSPNAFAAPEGFTVGRWEGNTLTARTTNVKTAWIRRGNGIPGSDRSTYTVHITRHEDLLTVVTIQEDPLYLTEPHVVSRVWQLDPKLPPGQYVEPVCNTANEIPRLEDSGIVPHYLPGQNPEADFMIRQYKLPKEGALGYAASLYPEFRKTIRDSYVPPATCERYCCGWIERQGLPGGAPGLTCNDGGLADLTARGRRKVGEESAKKK